MMFAMMGLDGWIKIYNCTVVLFSGLKLQRASIV
jgi:hypothetical protein